MTVFPFPAAGAGKVWLTKKNGKVMGQMLARWNEFSWRLAAKMAVWKMRLTSEKGQTLVEYGLILALIAVVVIGVIAAIGGKLGSIFGTVNNTLNNAP
jgi:pilus assembly protein Flp/PilA